jgi:hypothetical protein
MPGKTQVPAVEDMDQQTFRLHIRARHPHLGFWNRENHNEDLCRRRQDHTHKPRKNDRDTS